MAQPLHLSPNGRSTVNVVALVAAVVVLWWRMGRLEDQVQSLTAAVVALEVRLGPAHTGR